MSELEKIVEIVRTLNTHIIDNPDIIETVGIMRIAGTKAKRNSIIELVMHGQPLQDVSVHELTDVYKHYLQFEPTEILNILSKSNDYHDISKKLASSDTDSDLCSELISDSINKLATSNDLKEIYASEIIYSYFHLATKIAEHSENNKMGAKQMGVILGPFISTLFNVEPMTLEHANIFNDACQKLIASGKFNSSFHAKHPEQSIKVLEILKEQNTQQQIRYREMESKQLILEESLNKTTTKLKILTTLLNKSKKDHKTPKRNIDSLQSDIHNQQKTLEQTLTIIEKYKNILSNERRLMSRTTKSIAWLNRRCKTEDWNFSPPPLILSQRPRSVETKLIQLEVTKDDGFRAKPKGKL